MEMDFNKWYVNEKQDLEGQIGWDIYTNYGVRSEHNVCFGASQSLTKGFCAMREKKQKKT